MPNYAKMFTRRKDGSYQGKYKDAAGKWHTVSNADPEVLYHRLEQLKNPPPLTFGEILDAWQAEHDEEIGYKARESYVTPCKRLKAEWGDLAAGSVTPRMITDYLSEMGKKRYSRRTVQLVMTVLHMTFHRALIRGEVDRDPTQAASMPRGLMTKRREVPEDSALSAVLASGETSFGPFALILYYTGLRRGEALALRQGDIDRKKRIISVRRSLTWTPNMPEVKEPKTEAGIREVHFPKELLPFLPDRDPLFPDPKTGEYMTLNHFTYAWRLYCQEIGHDITCHQLRHYYATAMYEAGVPVLAAQAQLGHKHASTTMNIYTHLRNQKREEANALIDAFFSSSDKPVV